MATGKTFEDFKQFRNRDLAKAEGKQGYHIFDNATAQLIFDKKPTTLKALSQIKGFPEGGERINKYGNKIIQWFMSSSMFAK
ncbi:HRDC domain-containing protein [Lysinibacillus xylanilyticus]|uniref:HRDC domain-containing protein n=1 Tax=Lysinibacillus xylanilyticus TaxID=582475 RepID=UPI0036DB612D